MRAFVRTIFVLACFVGAYVLFMDSSTFLLYIPESYVEGERAGGCYTMLDDLFGTLRPSDALRTLEFWSSLGLTALTLGLPVWWWFQSSRGAQRVAA